MITNGCAYEPYYEEELNIGPYPIDELYYEESSDDDGSDYDSDLDSGYGTGSEVDSTQK